MIYMDIFVNKIDIRIEALIGIRIEIGIERSVDIMTGSISL